MLALSACTTACSCSGAITATGTSAQVADPLPNDKALTLCPGGSTKIASASRLS